MVKHTVKRQPRLLVFAGAGASVDSGLPTFRKTISTWDTSTGGVLWGDNDVDEICNFERLKQAHDIGSAAFIYNFYDTLRVKISLVKPNAFHHFIRDIILDGKWDVNVIHRYRCRRCQKTLDIAQKCSEHESLVATDTVFYGERSPYYSKGKRAFSRLCNGDTILMVGSSGETFGEAMTYWTKCRLRGVETIHVNPVGKPHHLYPSDHGMYCTIQQALPYLRKCFFS